MEMNIRYEPSNLIIKDENSIICPCCSNQLIKEIKKEQFVISECGSCGYGDRYSDRPFASNNRFRNETCYCEYGEKDCLYITCESCKKHSDDPMCIKCNGYIDYIRALDLFTRLCASCEKQKQFTQDWKTSTPQEKLNLYGTNKLKILAKNKKIKGYSKLNKNDLINILSQFVNENDFPIKSEF